MKKYIEELEIVNAYRGYQITCDYIGFRTGYLIAKNKSSKLDFDQVDFMRFLDEIGSTAKDFLDRFDVDYVTVDSERLSVETSIVDGLGVYVGAKVDKGELLGLSR